MELFHKILVTSSKGGIGKSTVALGVAAALSREGRRVLLVDCDAGNRCLDLMLGVEDTVLYDLSDVYEDRCTAEQAFLSCPGLPNLVFCAAPGDPFSDLDKERFCHTLTALAEASYADFVICDTAGRLHNKKNLMDELNKISRIIARELPEADCETLLVLDGTTGQNGLIQAKQFKEIAGVTCVALTKLDGTAKGGIVIAVADALQLPVKFVGVGEKADDLMPFEAKDFVDALL